LRNLHRQGFETFLPMQDVTQRHSTKFVQQRRPLFSGYMFVSFALDTAPWRKINSTVGVARLVSFDGQSKALPPDLIAGLMARCDTQQSLAARSICAGRWAPSYEWTLRRICCDHWNDRCRI